MASDNTRTGPTRLTSAYSGPKNIKTLACISQFQRYARVQTDRQKDKLIAILRSPT